MSSGLRDSAFPGLATLAGVIWIVVGSLFVLAALVDLALLVAGAAGPPGRVACRMGCGSMFAAAFLVAGVRTARGTIGGLGLPAGGSIALGLPYLGLGLGVLVNLGAAKNPQEALFLLIAGPACGLIGLGLIAAGAMALSANRRYREWRRPMERQRYREQRRRREADEPPE